MSGPAPEGRGRVHIDGGLSRAATIRGLDMPADAVDRVVDLYEASAHKRAMPSPPER